MKKTLPCEMDEFHA